MKDVKVPKCPICGSTLAETGKHELLSMDEFANNVTQSTKSWECPNPKCPTSKITSRCGLNCNDCPAFITTTTNNDELRQETADEWNERYNATGRSPITKEDINCLGCLSVIEPVYKHCKECKVRICGIEKEIQNCGECSDYKTCTKISSLHEQIPEGKEICDKVNEVIKSTSF